MKKAAIKEMASYIPKQEMSNADVESRISANGFEVPKGLLKSIMGSETRYYADKSEQASDLAVAAARKLLDRFPMEDVDLLIFAAACGDLIEPATANIVQTKLGLTCPAFDVKNACNSVVNAMEVATAFVRSGQYQNILIVSGEKTSDSIKFDVTDQTEFKDRFASYSFGDGGFAVLIGESERGEGFEFQRQVTYGQHWPLCTIRGGGSMFPHEVNQLFFSGMTFELKKIFQEEAPPFIQQCLKQAGRPLEEVDLICTHQVSNSTFEHLAAGISCDLDKIAKTFDQYGNTAATALPISLQQAVANQVVGAGSLVLLVGLAAGINISVQLMTI